MGRHSIPDPEDSAGEDAPEGTADPAVRSTASRPPRARYDDDPRLPTSPSYDESTGLRANTDYDEPDDPDADYPEPDEDARAAAAGGAVARPLPRHGRRRAQHTGEWEGGEWTGSHRAVQPGRRGVSVGVIAALVAVVVVVGGVHPVAVLR